MFGNNLEFLDMLSIISFIMQVNQIQNNNKHMKEIEEKIEHIVKKLDLVDDKVLQSLTERYGNNGQL
jgi:hypothetical protein